MSKLNPIFGKMSGKLGGTVFVISNGQQIAREYNPAPSNPKSDLQMKQRAKGNLVGRVSSFTPKSALFGLGANNRRRRAMFLRILLRNATVAGSEGVYDAKLYDNDIVFSRGSSQMVMTLSTIVAGSHRVVVTLSGATSAEIDPAVYDASLVRLVCMVYDATTNDLLEVSTKIANKPEQGANLATNIQVATSGSYLAVVYAIPMSTSDGSAASVDAGLAMRDDDTIAASLSVNRDAVVFNYGNSIVLGSANFTQA